MNMGCQDSTFWYRETLTSWHFVKWQFSLRWEVGSPPPTTRLGKAWNSKVHYRVLKTSPLVPDLRQMNPVHTLPPYFSKIHSNIIFPSTASLPSGLFPSGFPTEILYTLLIYLLRGTCPAHIILLDFVTLIVFGESYKLWSSSSWGPLGCGAV